MNACAIVLGSGSSKRMGGYDKLLTEMLGDPMIVWSLRAFEQCSAIHSIVVTTSISNDEQIRVAVNKSRLTKVHTYVHGGSSRSESTLLGLRALAEQHPAFVVIHDGARPFVTTEIIERGLRSAELYGAAIPAIPVTDTLKRVNHENIVVDTPQRTSMWHAQTPQVARYEELLNVHEHKCGELDQFTDEASLLESAGIPVRIFEGDYDNLKITTPSTLAMALRIAGERRRAAEFPDRKL